MTKLSALLASISLLLIFIKPVTASVVVKQTDVYSASLNVWQVIHELGSDLEGSLGKFTFRVHTNLPRNMQFDFTALNTRIYDKSTNSLVVNSGCIPQNSDTNDRLRGLIFNQQGVPEGFEDVTIDFSCQNFSFIKGHRYLIELSNANAAAFGGMRMQLASSAYGTSGQDFFTPGGLRYAFDNASCSPLAYIWNSQTANSGCNVFTSTKDDLYFILSDNAPEPTPTPTSTPTPTPTPEPIKTPLILIPGIGGSELKVAEDTVWNKDDGHGGTFSHAYAKDERVWMNEPEARAIGEDDYFDILRMNADGINSDANLKLTNNLLARAYQNAIDLFTANGYILNKDFFIFPYDWRKDIGTTKLELDNQISQIKNQTGSQKVDIVAHSMGGLVARNYIADSIKAQNVRKLFTLGTPYLGSVKFLKTILYGDCLWLEIGPFCLTIAPSELKDVAQNLISAFELAPSQTYFSFYTNQDNDHPYPYRTESGTLNYTQIKNLLTSFGHNTSLFSPSEAFHLMDTSYTNTNGVDVTVIAGSGNPTLGQIIEEKTTSLIGIQTIHKDMIEINGDDTVPLYSASLNDPAKNQSLLGSAKLYYTNQKHGDLVTSGPALNLVKNILNGNSQIPTGVSIQPYNFTGTTLSVHSPVNIHVYDASGNHTGSTSDGFEANIPGSSYDTLGDAKFVYLPESGTYTVKFEATSQGSFDFKIKKFENDINTETILYKDVALTTSTKAQATLDTSAIQTPVLQVDQDGNGTTDTQVSATSTLTGNVNYDETPPKTTISLDGTEGNNGWYKSDVSVTLVALDETNGSGIQKTEYSLNNSQTVQIYTQSFTISTEGITKLKFKSTDKAGNEEAPQEVEIKIDKTSPEVKVFVDQDKQDLIVEGMDQNPTITERSDNPETKKKDDAIYKITDSAGNTLKLDVRERDKEKQDRFRIYSIQYNGNPVQVLDNNHFNVNYQNKKDKLNVKEQNFELKGEVKIRIQYDQRKNKSTIIVKEPKEEKVKETRNGLVILQLTTKKGELETTY